MKMKVLCLMIVATVFIYSLNVNAKQGTVSIAFESRTNAYKVLSQNLGLSRGKEDKDFVQLIYEEVIEAAEEVEEEADSRMTQISDGLEADFGDG